MPHTENCFIILKSKMSHLFFSPSLDNKKRRFKWFHCYVINLYTQHELRRPCGPQVIMETIIVTVGKEYVVPSPSSTSHGQWMGPPIWVWHLGLDI